MEEKIWHWAIDKLTNWTFQYNASKACVIHLAKSLAVEWVDWCRVNCISPGYISTEMIGSLSEEWKTKWMDLVPAKRFCDPAELKGVSSTMISSCCAGFGTDCSNVTPGLCLLCIRCIELHDRCRYYHRWCLYRMLTG